MNNACRTEQPALFPESDCYGVPAANEDEVFIAQSTFEESLDKRDIPVEVSRAFWVQLDKMTGVELDASSGAVTRTYPEKLKAVRRINDRRQGLVSIDGLVDGLASGDFLRKIHTSQNGHDELIGTGIGPRRLAMIAILGHTYTPDRSTEIDAAVSAYKVPVKNVLNFFRRKNMSDEEIVAEFGENWYLDTSI